MNRLAAWLGPCLGGILWLVGSGVSGNLLGATYFVAPDGSDANPGTSLAAPWRTLQQAATHLVAGDTCLIRGGLYRETLSPTHSGTSNAPITFQAYSNEVVTLSASEPVTGWTYRSNGLYQATVDWDLGTGYNQVFVDGAMLHQARFPAYGNAGLLAPATVEVSVDPVSPNLIHSASFAGHPADFWTGTWFSGVVGKGWSWQCARVLSSQGDTVMVDSATESKPWFSGQGRGALWGRLALLTSENQWHFQPTTHRLYLRLAGDSDPGQHTVEMKRRCWCVAFTNCNYIVLRGLACRGGAVRLQGNGNVLENCRVRYASHFLTFTSGLSHHGDRPEGAGVLVRGTNNVVRGCVIADTAGSGISSSGAHNLLTRNLVENTDYSGTYACAIRLTGTEDEVCFNTAQNSGRDILEPAGAGHRICYNDLLGAGHLCRDVGVVYVWGANGAASNGPCTRLAYNWIHDHAGTDPGPLVYLDNWTRNFVVDHNVLWNAAGDAGIRINAPACGDRLYNNTLFNCDDLGTHTYDMWPRENPDPAFWKTDAYQYAALNNLFLGSNPQAQLRDWQRRDFRLKPGALAVGKGIFIPGYTPAPGGEPPDPGAYQQAGPAWVPGVNGFVQPKLNVALNGPNLLLSLPAEATTQYQLWQADQPQGHWERLTNAPVASGTQWRLSLNLAGPHFFRLQSR